MATDREWHRSMGIDAYVVSTSRTLLSHSAIQSFFAHEEMYWAKAVPMEHLQLMLDNCLTFGLYIKSAAVSTQCSDGTAGPAALTQIGMARLISDLCTAAYLKDVFVLPEYQGKGLGSWMVACCGEVVNDFPQPTRFMLFHKQATGSWYQNLLGVEEYQQGANGNIFASMRTKSKKSGPSPLNSGDHSEMVN